MRGREATDFVYTPLFRPFPPCHHPFDQAFQRSLFNLPTKNPVLDGVFAAVNYTATLDYTETLGGGDNAHNPAAIGALHRKHHGAVCLGE